LEGRQLALASTSLAAEEIDRISVLHPKGFNMSLDNIRRVLKALGDPHLRMPPTIHVAGTNGKGSVVAFCRALLEAQGLSVHVHISPHLVNWHERYRIGVKGGRAISSTTLCLRMLSVASTT